MSKRDRLGYDGRMWRRLIIAGPAWLAVAWATGAAAQSLLRDDTEHVRRWNAFADQLMAIHRHWLATEPTAKTARKGDYARRPGAYTEAAYSDPASGRLRTRIRWLSAKPDTAHTIEVYVYDMAGRLAQDYAAAYLMEHRNAPVQTLINLHAYNGDLHAFRQFDASGDHIFERCAGEFEGAAVDIALDEPEVPPPADHVAPALYAACFGSLPEAAGKFLNPAALVPGLAEADTDRRVRDGDQRLAMLDTRISLTPENAKLYVERSQLHFVYHRFKAAARDFTRAIELDPTLDAAYYGRGLALGRIGEVTAGIRDLDHYIERNPKSAKAHTKRGVRHIWNRDFEAAKRDLQRAVQLDPSSAEAHDDLGVVLAQTGDLFGAIPHFEMARRLDPRYPKPHHNLGMALYMTGRAEAALEAVDAALALDARARNTLLLKSTILDALGRDAEARSLREAAEALPEGDWSERSHLE